MTKEAPKVGKKMKPTIAPKPLPRGPVNTAGKAGRAQLTKGLNLTEKPKAASNKPKWKPRNFHKDRLYRMEYSKLVKQTTEVDGLKLASLAELLKKKEIVVVTTNGEDFGMLPLTASTPHLRPYALVVLRSIAKEFKQKSGGYRLLVSSLFRSPSQQIKEAKTNPAAMDPSVSASTHLFGNTFDFTVNRYLDKNGKEVQDAALTKTLDAIIIDHQKRSMAMGYWEKAARHVIAAKPI